jgi:hypothetical protein
MLKISAFENLKVETIQGRKYADGTIILILSRIGRCDENKGFWFG